MIYEKLFIYTDGGARGNPGPAAIGVVIQDEKGKTVKTYSEYLGERTNNQAEYEALILGLQKVKIYKPKEIACFLDSELVVKQLNGEYKIKDPDIQPLFIKVWNLKLDFEKIFFRHIEREKNKEADKLVNQKLDTQKLF